MPPRSYSPTLSSLVIARKGVSLLCDTPTCRGVKGYGPSGHPDLPVEKTVLALVLRFGEDATLDDLRRKVVCPTCGGKVFRLESWEG